MNFEHGDCLPRRQRVRACRCAPTGAGAGGRIQWAGSRFLHDTSWTVVGDQALPADMNPLTSVVYRDREAEWIGKGCIGSPPFGQG